MQSWGYAACVLLLCLTLSGAAAPSRRISNAEKTDIKKALEEGSRFTLEMLKATNIGPIAKKLTRVASSILPGLGTLFKLLEFFSPEDNSLEDEIMKGFDRVVGKLEDIESSLGDILREMKYLNVKNHIMDYLGKIGLMEEKLKAIVHAPNKHDAIAYFKKVYDKEYGEAGVNLANLIVKTHILQYAVNYTQNHRPKLVKLMQKLISALLQASTVELAYEKFNNQQRGVMEEWVSRFTKVSKEMIAVDEQVVKDWKIYFTREVDKMASKLKDKKHQDFSNGMYSFFKSKYPWRHWFVLSYDELHSNRDHHLLCNSCEFRFRIYSRNFVISSTSPPGKFNKPVAVPKNVICKDNLYVCRDGAAEKICDASPWPSSAVRVVMLRNAGWAWKAEGSRVAVTYSTLICYYTEQYYNSMTAYSRRVSREWLMKTIYFG